MAKLTLANRKCNNEHHILQQLSNLEFVLQI